MHKHSPLIIPLTIFYIVAVSIYMLAHRMWFSPDQFFIFALFGAMFLGRTKQFILDWGPFLLLFFGYEFLKGLIPLVSQEAHTMPLIQADQLMFGFIPTIQLQAALYNPAYLHWYDYVAVLFYICHFVTPMVIGFWFWLTDRSLFKEYALALILLSYAAFFTFIVYPATPPWLASNEGYLPPIQEITPHVMANFLPTAIPVPTVYAFMRANPVAAMPSLHAAIPTLVLLFLIKKYHRKGWLFLPYVFGVWFAVMYLGEHYFIDIVFGAIYAAAAFAVVVEKKAIQQLLIKLGRGVTKATQLPKAAASLSSIYTRSHTK